MKSLIDGCIVSYSLTNVPTTWTKLVVKGSAETDYAIAAVVAEDECI